MERVKKFFHRHRRGIAITAAVAAAGYLTYTFLRQKAKDLTEATSTERNDQENLRRRFIQNQQDSMFSILALHPNMAQQILEELRVEPILAELQQKRVVTTGGASSVRALSASDEGDSGTRASMITTNTNFEGGNGEKTVLVTQKKSKTELWNQLKIMSLVRTLTLIYASSTLVLLSRIQFNLLGRQAYVASILALAPESSSGSPAVQQIRLREETGLGDLELQRSFLAFSWWLLHRGWKTIMTRVNSAVEDVFNTVSPKDIVSPDTLRTLFAQVRQQVEFQPSIPQPRPYTFLSALLPPTPQDELLVLSQDSLVPNTVSDDLRRLLDETSDIIESPAAMTVLHILLDRAFEEFVVVLQSETKASRDGVIRLANYLPVATKEAEKIAHSVPNRYFQVMEEVEELSSLAAIVYGNWDSEALKEARHSE